MKSAIVLGARQQYGFKLCEELLEQGYQVNAMDFNQWQTTEQEEKWLFIGRNANLHYAPLHENENISDNQALILIVPLIDFYSRQKTEAHDALLSILKKLNELQAQTPLVLIQPLTIQRSYSTFSQEIEKIKEDRIKMDGEVLEYHIMIGRDMENEDIYFRDNEKSGWIRNIESEKILSAIRRHIEERVQIEES
ncbi:hypothetical protein [Bacillus sp. SD088]|uniref:hypothetical protein n=1 Tax=Bacillus sp. SD088 TaxID=2782012 RepID=UPI001A96BBE2|nr:hypothetical protein [Bacillus sp. SD088]MBO0993661.1 hypothetical protein [Bacillus sp. SD088]